MQFNITSIKEIDRHTEPAVWDIPMGASMPPKHEEITLIIELTSSGDTRTFTSGEIRSIIWDKIRTLKPTK
jgi:hypothetical protein